MQLELPDLKDAKLPCDQENPTVASKSFLITIGEPFKLQVWLHVDQLVSPMAGACCKMQQ